MTTTGYYPAEQTLDTNSSSFLFSKLGLKCFPELLRTHCGAETPVPAQSPFPLLQDWAAVLSVTRGREQGALVCSSKELACFFP